MPIIDYLLRQQDRGELGPGVRALLLYPMNALANDQLKRIRELLQHLPTITFGRYTGDTLPSRGQGEQQYREEHLNSMKFREPLKNEMVSREEMHANPPHLLLTNYAMLEYLLLRLSTPPSVATSGGLSSWTKPIPMTVREVSRSRCSCVA